MTRSALLCGLIAVFLALCLLPQSPAFAYWKKDGNPVCGNPEIQDSSRIVSDLAGGAFVVWEDRRSDWFDIYVQHIDSTGKALWNSDGIVACTASDHQVHPQAISDGAGGVIITWQDYRDSLDSGSDIYVQRMTSSGTPVWTANGVAVCTELYDQISPQLSLDGANGVVITWEDYRGASYGNIYAQRIDSTGSATWTENGVIICGAGGWQGNPSIVTDGGGGGIVVWEDRRGNGVEIYAQHIAADGLLRWAPAPEWGVWGLPIGDTPGLQSCPRICPATSSPQRFSPRRWCPWKSMDVSAF